MSSGTGASDPGPDFAWAKLLWTRAQICDARGTREGKETGMGSDGLRKLSDTECPGLYSGGPCAPTLGIQTMFDSALAVTQDFGIFLFTRNAFFSWLG